MLKKWDDLPDFMRVTEVRPYYDALKKKTVSLIFKRIFDIVVSFIMLVVLSPLFLILTIAIKLDSQGPVFYRQVRVTQYGRKFRIFKFSSMVQNADKGSQVTVNNDMRVTGVGHIIRRLRLDEISQLLNVLFGDMTFVGTRPEVLKYVEQYTPEMIATLLLPAGVTSEASIYYKDEAKLLNTAEDTDKAYLEDVLPGKMYYNLKAIVHFSFWHDIKVMLMTVLSICGKVYVGDYDDITIEKAENKRNEVLFNTYKGR
jgi:lipopolysaccharide/colanic/teichoic acid biosynthesis glycosyltransferase